MLKKNGIIIAGIVTGVMLVQTFFAFANDYAGCNIGAIDFLCENDIEAVQLKLDDGRAIASESDFSADVSVGDTLNIEIHDYDETETEPEKIIANACVDDNSEMRLIGNKLLAKGEAYSSVAEIGKGEFRICFIINGEDSPEEYKIDYDLPGNQHLEFAEYNGETDGSIVIVDDEKGPISAIAVPWARDAKGKDVETYYRIEGNSLIQVVKHQDNNYNYPVVADPFEKYSDWFKSSTWEERDSGIYLRVVPTSWNRQSGIAYAQVSWNLLKEKMSDTESWYNEEGLKDQCYCHTQMAKLKDSWNLEPWRPNVGLIRTIAKGCNP